MLHAAARFRPAFLVALSIPITAALAFAGEVPTTAHSVSLGMPPLLVDHVALTALFPQRLPGQPPQVFGWQMGYSSNAGVGGIAPLEGRAVGMVLSQRHQSLTALEQQQVQLALGGMLGSIRLGAAIRGFEDDSQQSRTEDLGGITSDSVAGTRFSFLEGALGVQLSVRGATVDLLGEFRDEESESHSTSEQSNGIAYSSLRRAITRSAFRFAARAEAPIARELVAVAGAIVQTGDRVWTTSRRVPSGPGSQLTVSDNDLAFSGGIALAHPVDESGEVTVFIYRSGQDTGWFQGYDHIATSERVRSQVGAAWRGDVLPRTQLLLGVGITRDSTRSQSKLDSNGQYRSEVGEERILHEDFSWGLTHQWRMLQLAGAMRSTLDLDDLFLVVDAGLVF